MTDPQADKDLPGIKQLCWGPKINADIFRRWSQGFCFSHTEPTALEQSEGGPCAVIAPVQAFILKGLLQKYPDLSFRDETFTDDSKNAMLVEALCEILGQANATGRDYRVVALNSGFDYRAAHQQQQQQHIAKDHGPTTVMENGGLSPEQAEECPQAFKFHDSLRVQTFVSLDEVRKYCNENVEGLKSPYSILLFLYSVIATRGLDLVKSDITTSPLDDLEPMIELPFGYGSQGIINLMLTGRATLNLFDNEQDLGGGMILKGLEKQNKIGFLSYLENLRHVTVGSFYKNPIHPVWVMASDTHLTVLFSPERKLVSPETKADQARRVFRQYDPDGNNFIKAQELPNVFQALDLVSDPQYIEFVTRRLDPESLGIILLKPFMDEFFQEEYRTPDTFLLYHYNGLAQSNHNVQIRYHEGSCVLLEQCELKAVCESNPMLTTLQTKWPNIEVRWSTVATPSLN